MPVRKRFGQHFLHDRSVIGRIVQAVSPVAGERVVEIGPGRGALTFALLERLPMLDAVEIDRDLAAQLALDPRAAGRLRLHVGDALATDYLALRGDGPPLRIVGNLPYNISTPLLFHLLHQRGAVADMYFMLQKEVVDRMVARPGIKAYGRLSVMLAAHAEVRRLFDVGPGSFKPPPKVWSSVVHVRPIGAPAFDFGGDAALRTLVTTAFSHRRKTLKNGLQDLLSVEEITACGIDPALRPEVLEPAQFGRLAASLHGRREAAKTPTS